MVRSFRCAETERIFRGGVSRVFPPEMLQWARRKREGDSMGETRYTLQSEEVLEHGRLPSVHPGELLREEFLEPLGMTAYQLAKRIGVEQTRISEILHGKRGISADTALRLARCFSTSAQMWMNFQARDELEEDEARMGDTLAQIQPREVAPA
jgi:addiction module HigA family antidote